MKTNELINCLSTAVVSAGYDSCREGCSNIHEWTFPGRGKTNRPKWAIVNLVCSRDPCRPRARPNLIVRSQRFGKVIHCRAYKLNLNLTLPPRAVAALTEKMGVSNSVGYILELENDILSHTLFLFCEVFKYAKMVKRQVGVSPAMRTINK